MHVPGCPIHDDVIIMRDIKSHTLSVGTCLSNTFDCCY